jgi:hypothetical protein
MSTGDTERPYRGYSEYALYRQIDQARAQSENADRERNTVISAYNGTAAVLEDEDYKSATARRMQLDDAIFEMETELEIRRAELR